jgi:hypothetical protein
MVKCDDFVYIFHGERFAKGGAPVDKILILKQPLENKFTKAVKGALTVRPLSRWLLHLFLLPILLRFLGCHFQIRSPRVARGLRGKGRGDFGWIGALEEGEGGLRLYLGDLESSWLIADWKRGFYPQVTAGLNNRRLDSDLLFRRGRTVKGNIRKPRGRLVDSWINYSINHFSGSIVPKKGFF